MAAPNDKSSATGVQTDPSGAYGDARAVYALQGQELLLLPGAVQLVGPAGYAPDQALMLRLQHEEESHRETKRQLSRAQDELKEAQDRIRDLECTLAAKSEEIVRLEGRVTELRGKLLASEKTIDALQSELTAARKAIKGLQDDNKQVREELKESNAKIESLRDDNKQLRKELNEDKAAMAARQVVYNVETRMRAWLWPDLPLLTLRSGRMVPVGFDCLCYFLRDLARRKPPTSDIQGQEFETSNFMTKSLVTVFNSLPGDGRVALLNNWDQLNTVMKQQGVAIKAWKDASKQLRVAGNTIAHPDDVPSESWDATVLKAQELVVAQSWPMLTSTSIDMNRSLSLLNSLSLSSLPLS
ncbi:uncharacterized protein MONBRDRAFT_26711 [Monosiga brevicollis MX1]|uniref:Uncharacterized protein n=1 Tax=Monosiga brevicollis TaxID=81824 RepID=A9V353_MONBE|nr:uncharacterized protein MONBRDRAFT_26711 [Monosiga brevicollis MX1]EDQ88000.1 predicted protein [Monosiga brevicollis MX1]|eukprot:XP_001747076.1 hypothetical protein [Monosiga brevicollis MX1]